MTWFEGLSQHLSGVAEESNESFYDSRGVCIVHIRSNVRSVALLPTGLSGIGSVFVSLCAFMCYASNINIRHVKLITPVSKTVISRNIILCFVIFTHF